MKLNVLQVCSVFHILVNTDLKQSPSSSLLVTGTRTPWVRTYISADQWKVSLLTWPQACTEPWKTVTIGRLGFWFTRVTMSVSTTDGGQVQCYSRALYRPMLTPPPRTVRVGPACSHTKSFRQGTLKTLIKFGFQSLNHPGQWMVFTWKGTLKAQNIP